MTARELHHVESERAVLGILIEDFARLDEVRGTLASTDFYRPDLGRLYDLVATMAANGEPSGILSVSERVLAHRMGDEAFGGYAGVLRCHADRPVPAGLKHYARTVARLATLRRARRALVAELEAIDGGEIEAPAELSARLDLVSAECRAKHETATWQKWGAAHDDALKEIEETSQGKRVRRFIPMPWSSVASIVPTVRAGSLGIVAARPAMGKSAFALQLAECAAAMNPGVAVGVFSLEMPASQIAYRAIAGATGVSVRDLQAGRLDQRAWDTIEDLRGSWDVPVFINRASALTVEDIVAETMALKRACAADALDLRMIVVDYIGLVVSSRHTLRDTVAARIAHVSRTLKQLAIGADLGVVALAQLNRKVEERPDKRPGMADLRDSGAIEQDADWIAMLYREVVYNKEADATRAEALFVKNRDGELGVAQLRFDGPRLRFHDDDPLHLDVLGVE